MTCSSMATGRSESPNSAPAQGIVVQCVFYGNSDSDRPSHGRTDDPTLIHDEEGGGLQNLKSPYERKLM